MPVAKSRVLRHARVTPIRPLSQLAVGQAALARGAWREARRAFQAVLAREESPEALEGLGLAAWWLDSADLVFKSRERAYRLYRHRDDRASAARVGPVEFKYVNPNDDPRHTKKSRTSEQEGDRHAHWWISFLGFFGGLITMKMAVLIEQTLIVVMVAAVATRTTAVGAR